MAMETELEKTETVPKAVLVDAVSKLADEPAASVKDRIPSDSTSASSGDMTSRKNAERDPVGTIKSETDQSTVVQPGVYAPPTSSYSYLYPGYNGPFEQLDKYCYFQPNGSHAGLQPENGSMIYYMPGYNPYASGPVVGITGQSVGQQQYFSPSGYAHPPPQYGSDALPCYSWDSTYVGDLSNSKCGSGSTACTEVDGRNAVKSNDNISSKFSKAAYAQSVRPPNKGSSSGTDYMVGLTKGYYHPAAKFSSFNGQKQGLYSHNSTFNNRHNGLMWNGDYRNNLRDGFNRVNNFDNVTELIRGPRAFNKNTTLTSASKKDLGVIVHKEQYNLPDFETEYTNAKFYVIKSYSEDDVHKSIKYDVWASTPNGNKKLDAAFRDAEEISNGAGKNCPIFLFFSVNRSGQFVGLAEMVGRVDFDKDMDFWQLDKWNGFFPVKWHVVKDIPNNHLRHIVLENNEGNPVTYSRDTQEIGLKQGLEMLNIFKSYSAKTSLLDDFSFYENREKSANTKKGNKPATLRMEIYENEDSPDPTIIGDRKHEEDSRTKHATNYSSIVSLTKNLNLNGCNARSNSVKKIENSVAAVPAP